jgi:hypothetical protein
MGYAGYPPYPPAMAMPRVAKHLQPLGVLWCIYGLYRVFSGLLGLFVFRAMTWRHFGGPDWPFSMHGPAWMALMPVIVTTTVVMAGLGLFVGYSLLTRKPWGRVLAIVLAVLALFKLPLGTALGIYTLWVLGPATSGMEYDALADQS